ncbi:DUF1285 domain-containing protein [Thalassotalea sp. G2M2-11]|uniref:DUF1285 domain-containing protein n=1 Tax=Thalassotalea sp. G2M2-11 TaxID=2787627 RepID=UPI0019D11BCA|nr:DUF1285 domain-containing protein [Thalassotalea sp. G2M2-11]
MSIEQISQQISQLSDDEQSLPPVELWDPPYCGEIDICIKANGDWYYNGSIFKRQALVKLFASVLKKEQDDYFLVTPVEKVKITVEDAPLLITQWQWLDSDKRQMQLITNLGDRFVLNQDHPMKLSDEGTLYVNVRRNLYAKVHRNVYYQWADLATETEHNDKQVLAFTSAGQQFVLGELE